MANNVVDFGDLTEEGGKPVDLGDVGKPTPSQKTQGEIRQGPDKWKYTFADIARPVLETAGMVGGGIIGTGAAPVAGTIAGAGLGYGMGRQAANILEQRLGITKPPTLKQAGIGALKDVGAGAAMEMGGQAVGPALSMLGKGVSYAGKGTLGRLTGAGGGAIEEAFKSGYETKAPWRSQTEFAKAMRGKTTGEDVVDMAKSALGKIKDQRAAAYQGRLAEISKNQADIDTSPVRVKLSDLMKKYNVKITPEGKLDTSRIAMGRSGRRDIAEVIKRVNSWGSQPGDNTVLGLDTLKRQLDDFYSDSSQARQFVASLKDAVRQTASKAVPEYEEMTKGYSEATKLIKDIESGLMLRKQGMSGRIVSDQTLRRLTSSMKENFALRNDLVQVLGAKGGEDVAGAIAGYTMRSPVPIGLAGAGPALIGEAALAHYINPAFWPALAASSPRVSGEFLQALGYSKKIANVILDSIPKNAKSAALRAMMITTKDSTEKRQGMTPIEQSVLTTEAPQRQSFGTPE